MVENMLLEIDICVCTFQRPQLKACLESIQTQVTTSAKLLSIIVSDNNDTPSAQSIVAEMSRNSTVPIRYVHAPRKNISVARNACIGAANAEFIAFIDDDEVAAEGWIEALARVHIETGANVILGPVNAIYPNGSPAWMVAEDIHSIKPVWVKGKIITGYTSNVLFRRTDPLIHLQTFDIARGRSGGEDTAFFSSFVCRGGQIEYAARAVVTEIVSADRLSFNWLASRAFRSGQTHGSLLEVSNPRRSNQALLAVLALLKASVCFGAALIAAIFTKHSHRWLLRGALHMGVAARLMGKTEAALYG